MLIAIDPGEKNIGVSYFNPNYLGSQLLSLNFQDFKEWLSSLNYITTIIVEHQLPQSKYNRLVYFLEGYCFAKNLPFYKRRLSFGKGLSYKQRKQKSVKLFQQRTGITADIKLDDIADSFNLGYNFLY